MALAGLAVNGTGQVWVCSKMKAFPQRFTLCRRATSAYVNFRSARISFSEAASRTFVPNSSALGNPYVAFAWIMLAKISTLLNQS